MQNVPPEAPAYQSGIVDGVPLLDLDYDEDSRRETDMNIVMTGADRFVEIQAPPKARRSRSTNCTP